MKKGNLKIVVDGGELARNINKKKTNKRHASQQMPVKTTIGESVSSISMLNIVSQLRIQ